MSRFDAQVARRLGWPGSDLPSTPAAETVAPSPLAQAPRLEETDFEDTAQDVIAAELEVIGELHELVTSWRLSPWQAAFALFNPINEGDGS